MDTDKIIIILMFNVNVAINKLKIIKVEFTPVKLHHVIYILL